MQDDSATRLDIHNAAVDEQIADAHHLCGNMDLQTGRTCIKPFHHYGSCHFVSKDAARRGTQVAGLQ